MKNKKIFFTFFLLSAIFWLSGTIVRATGIDFKPNVKIPNTPFDAPVVEITNSSLGEYIVALYNYGSIFAGFVAMFMLVYAGWQWLMAAGRLDKIAQAKHTIAGVLVGLGLLFGSYILMSQISERLVNFSALDIRAIETLPGMDQACDQALATSTLECGQTREVPTTNYGRMVCVSRECPSANLTCTDLNTGSPCPAVVNSFSGDPPDCSCISTDCSVLNLNSCGDYKSLDMCRNNACLNKQVNGGTTFTQVCGVDSGKCKALQDVRCAASSNCDWDGSGTWCCADRNASRDYCRIDRNVDPNGSPNTDSCKD